MCGRFNLTRPKDIVERFGFMDWSEKRIEPRFNIAPSQEILTIVQEPLEVRPTATCGQDRLVGRTSSDSFCPGPVRPDGSSAEALGGAFAQMAVWGLKPFWLDQAKKRPPPINARAESLTTSRMFREAKRCLIPATGFYEWRNRQPMHIQLKDGQLFAFAGLWLPANHFSRVPTVAILTTRPNELMAGIHTRMPAILRPEDELRWLDPAFDAADAKDVLRPLDAEVMEAYPVAPLVNSWENEGPALIEPLSAESGEEVQMGLPLE
jgi:putative SOS response-associated peptidase YedK